MISENFFKIGEKTSISVEDNISRFIFLVVLPYRFVDSICNAKHSKNIIGTGLGLSIASDIMQGLKGNLKIKFERGEIFCVSLLFSL